jgi:hypothetical protein
LAGAHKGNTAELEEQLNKQKKIACQTKKKTTKY